MLNLDAVRQQMHTARGVAEEIWPDDMRKQTEPPPRVSENRSENQMMPSARTQTRAQRLSGVSFCFCCVSLRLRGIMVSGNFVEAAVPSANAMNQPMPVQCHLTWCMRAVFPQLCHESAQLC